MSSSPAFGQSLALHGVQSAEVLALLRAHWPLALRAHEGPVDQVEATEAHGRRELEGT